MAQTPSGISEAYSGVGISRENREDRLHPECAWYHTMGWVPRLNKKREERKLSTKVHPSFWSLIHPWWECSPRLLLSCLCPRGRLTPPKLPPLTLLLCQEFCYSHRRSNEHSKWQKYTKIFSKSNLHLKPLGTVWRLGWVLHSSDSIANTWGSPCSPTWFRVLREESLNFEEKNTRTLPVILVHILSSPPPMNFTFLFSLKLSTIRDCGILRCIVSPPSYR